MNMMMRFVMFKFKNESKQRMMVAMANSSIKNTSHQALLS